MRFFVLCVFVALWASVLPAFAGQAEVKDIARQNNCPPKKIDVQHNALGENGRTLYRVTCILPKVTEKEDAPLDALVIACTGSLCELVRPAEGEKK